MLKMLKIAKFTIASLNNDIFSFTWCIIKTRPRLLFCLKFVLIFILIY